MKSDELVAEQVFARRDAVGDLDIPATVVSNQLVDGPFASRLVETLFSDLEPLEAGDTEASGIVDLGTEGIVSD